MKTDMTLKVSGGEKIVLTRDGYEDQIFIVPFGATSVRIEQWDGARFWRRDISVRSSGVIFSTVSFACLRRVSRSSRILFHHFLPSAASRASGL